MGLIFFLTPNSHSKYVHSNQFTSSVHTKYKFNFTIILGVLAIEADFTMKSNPKQLEFSDFYQDSFVNKTTFWQVTKQSQYFINVPNHCLVILHPV